MGARGEGGCVGELTTGADPALPPAKKFLPALQADRSGAEGILVEKISSDTFRRYKIKFERKHISIILLNQKLKVCTF